MQHHLVDESTLEMTVSCIAEQRTDNPMQLADCRCEIVTDFSRLEAMKGDWEKLWHSDPRQSIFLSFAWVRAWWRAFAHKLTLCSLIVLEEDRLAAVLPLVVCKGEVRFLGSPLADYADVLCSPDSASRSLPLIFDGLRTLARRHPCVLENIPEDAHLVVDLPRYVPVWKRDAQLHWTGICPTILLSEDRVEDLDRLMRKSRLKRPNNKFCKSGVAGFRQIQSRQEAEQHLHLFFREHVQRHALMGQRSRFLDPDSCSFLLYLLEDFDLERSMRCAVLELDGKPVAHSIAFETERKLLIYQHAFNVEYSHLSPGDVQLRHLFQCAKDSSVCEVDFGRGGESYKDEFTNYRRRNFRMYIDRRSVRSRLRRGFRTLRYSVRAAVRQHPRLLERLQAFGSASPASLSRAISQRIGKIFAHLDFYRPSASTTAKLQSNLSTSGMVMEGTLSGLADAALETRRLTISMLDEYRRSLQRGERFLIAREGEGKYLMVWLRSLPEAPHSTRPVMLAHAFQTLRADETLYRPLLAACIREANASGADLCVCCPSGNRQLRQALNELGFATTHNAPEDEKVCFAMEWE